MLLALRGVGVLAGGVAGWQLGAWLSLPQGSTDLLLILLLTAIGAVLGAIVAPGLTVTPLLWTRYQIERRPALDLAAAGLGLIVGLVIAALLAWPLALLPPPVGQFAPIVAAAIFTYLAMAATISHKRDLAGWLGRGLAASPLAPTTRELLLDTSAIIDGRVADISQTGFLEGELLVPRFVLEELQYIADAGDTLRRNRGRRGLELLNRLQKESLVPIQVIEASLLDGQPVDANLIRLARERQCAIVTTDFNLNRVAELQGVRVLNVNELANAVRPVVLPGEELVVRLVQEGREAGQGVAYLDDGTMIVVDQGRRALGSERRVVVTRVLQTVAGRMIFAALREQEVPPEPRARGAERA